MNGEHRRHPPPSAGLSAYLDVLQPFAVIQHPAPISIIPQLHGFLFDSSVVSSTLGTHTYIGHLSVGLVWDVEIGEDGRRSGFCD